MDLLPINASTLFRHLTNANILPSSRSLRFHPLRLQDVVNQQGIVQKLHRLHRKDGIEFQYVLVSHPPNDHQPTVPGKRAYVSPSAVFIRCLE